MCLRRGVGRLVAPGDAARAHREGEGRRVGVGLRRRRAHRFGVFRCGDFAARLNAFFRLAQALDARVARQALFELRHLLVAQPIDDARAQGFEALHAAGATV